MDNVVPRAEYMTRIYVADFFSVLGRGGKPDFATALHDSLMLSPVLPNIGNQYHSGCKAPTPQLLCQTISCLQLPSVSSLLLSLCV